MKKTVITLSILLVTFALVGCGKVPTLKNGDEVVASVKGKKFSVEDLYNKLKAQGGEAVLTNIIDEYIVNKEVETDDEATSYADSQLASYKESYESNGQDFEKALKNAGYKDEDALKDALIVEHKKKVVTENYVKANLKDTEIDKYYEENIYGDIEAKHILIAPNTTDSMSDEDKTKAEEQAKEEAENIIKKLKKGEDFDKLAKKYSDDKGTAKKGGKLTVTYGEVVDEFWDATNKLKNKTYTESPVKTEYGYHIIYRISQKDKPSLKEVKDTVIDKLVEEKMDEDTTLTTKAMIDLRKKYKMEINDNDLKESYNNTVKEALAEN